MQKTWISLLLVFLTCAHELKGEIEEVIVTWNAFKCQSTCAAQIQQNFSVIQAVKNLTVNAAIGTATMGWDPKYPFSYEPFRYAAAAVGIRITTMRVRIRGTISNDSNNIYLVSNGDRTSFLLIGPIFTEPGRYTPKYNLTTHPLSAETRARLLEAEREGVNVVISGPLFLPSHYALTLISEQIKIEVP
jgi:hypothetical protein